jgi:KDO2-lipid IV(A) lauroyltransferase
VKLKKRIKHVFELFLLILIVNFLRIFTLKFSLFLATKLGKLLYRLNKKHRGRALHNLECSFPEKSKEECQIILRKVYINLSKTFIEMINLKRYQKKYMQKKISIVGQDHLDKALKLKKGIIGITAHLDNWELLGAILISYGYSCDAIYHPMRNKLTNKYINKLRTNMGVGLISFKNALRPCLRSLKDNHILGMISDQDAGRDGIFVDFFNRPASTVQGPAFFSIKTEAPVLFFYMVRKENDDHVLHITPPLKMKRKGDFKKNMKINTKLWSDELEKQVRKRPEQWFWVHRKWHSKPGN